MHGYEIPDGMVYVGAFLTSAPGGGWAVDIPAPCLITPSLKVAPGRLQSVSDMGYWPSYANTAPEHRQAYLTWLSTGKRDASFPVGYAFLYFYGLERRLLADNPGLDEEATLVAEVRRLQGVYAENRSFMGYSQRLLEVIELRRTFGDPAAFAAWTPDLLSVNRSEPMPLPLQIKLALHAVTCVPLGWELATAAMLAMSPYQGGLPSNIGMSRARREFIELVGRRFPSRFPDGFLLRDRKDSTLHLFYQAASRNLEVSIQVRGYDRLPDPRGLTWTKFAEFCGKIADELAPYAKAVGKDRTRADSLAAAIALPPDLADLGAAEPFRRWLEALPTPVAEVPLATLGRWCLGEGKEASGLKQAREMSAMLASVGFAMEPDPAHGGEKPGVEVLLFRLGDAAEAVPTPAFHHAAIAAAVLASTGPGPDSLRVMSELTSRLQLTGPEALRLTVRFRLMWGRALPAGKIKMLVGSLTEDERLVVAEAAAGACAVCEEVDQTAITGLERLYDACGVNRRKLYAVLHDGAAACAPRASEPVVVERGSAKRGAFRIPPPEPLKPMPGASDGLGIDMDRVKAIMLETREVTKILAPIYAEGEEEQPAQVEMPAAAAKGDGAAARWSGLNADHARLLEALCARGVWSRSDFEARARESGLMPDGAIETINEWAYDAFDEALIEDGDPLSINLALLHEAPEGTA